LDKIEEILSLPTDPKSGNVLRAQTACASAAIQAQLRADENRLKVHRSSDVMERLIKIVKEQRRKIPKKSAITETPLADATQVQAEA
jgi:hypothetical protein